MVRQAKENTSTPRATTGPISNQSVQSNSFFSLVKQHILVCIFACVYVCGYVCVPCCCCFYLLRYIKIHKASFKVSCYFSYKSSIFLGVFLNCPSVYTTVPCHDLVKPYSMTVTSPFRAIQNTKIYLVYSLRKNSLCYTSHSKHGKNRH